jgi:nicotinamide-nucleotide amidase
VSARGAIVVTGTELLGGRVSDRNGPWLAARFFELGIDLAHVTIVGDRPVDMLAALEWCSALGVSLIVTSGGLGPTADDLTASVVGGFAGRAMVLDVALEAQIAEILRPMRSRWPHLTEEEIRASNRKQAVVPEGATVLDPVGTAPGLVVPPAEGGDRPTVVVLPGPPRELQALWRAAIGTEAFARAVAGRTTYAERMLRLYGLPESQIAQTLRVAADRGIDFTRIEVTTCLRRGEIEIVTRFEAGDAAIYEAFVAVVRERHGEELFSEDGSLVDDHVAALLLERGLSLGVAESCTGGLLAGRLTERPGSSEYLRGGIVAYSDEVKEALVGVGHDVLVRHGAVSAQTALALADGARGRLSCDIGVGVTGIAGPGGGSAEKPVGLVFVAASAHDGRHIVRRSQLPGNRAEVRERTTTLAMHLLRRLLLGESDAAEVSERDASVESDPATESDTAAA